MARFLSAHSLTLIATVHLPVTPAGIGGRCAEQTRPLTLGFPHGELFLHSISPYNLLALEAGCGCISLAMHYLGTCVRREVCKAPNFILLSLLRIKLCVLCFFSFVRYILGPFLYFACLYTDMTRETHSLFACLFVADDEPRRDECCCGGDGGCGAVWSPYRLRQGTARPTTTTPRTPDVGREY